MSLILFIIVLSIGVTGGAMVVTARFMDKWRAEYSGDGFTF